MATRLSLLSCNIHKGFSAGNRRFTLHRLADGLRTAAPDVAFLQEVQGIHHGHAAVHSDWATAGQAQLLAAAVQGDHAYGANARYTQGDHGNALLSRRPLLGWTNHDVSNHRFERRGLLHGRIQVEGTPVHLVCCHLDLTRWGRERQIEKLGHLMRADIPPTESLVIAGDFNDWRGLADRLLADLGLIEVYTALHGRRARTFPAWWPRLPLDRIYVRGVRPVSAEVLSGEPWRSASDHLPLRCGVEVE